MKRRKLYDSPPPNTSGDLKSKSAVASKEQKKTNGTAIVASLLSLPSLSCSHPLRKAAEPFAEDAVIDHPAILRAIDKILLLQHFER